MATPGQRFEQSYVQGVGASGALLAAALIAFIAVVGLTSLELWPKSPGTPAALSVELPAASIASQNQDNSLSSTATAPLAGAQSTGLGSAAPAASTQKPAAGGRHDEKGATNKGGKNKSGSGNGINGGGGTTAPSETGGGQVTVVSPIPQPSSRSASSKGSGSGKSKSQHSVSKANGSGNSGAIDNPGRGHGKSKGKANGSPGHGRGKSGK
jgi:hypothetical protein